MREINEAWQVLRDPARRRAYDRDRVSARPGGGTAARRPPGRGGTVVRADEDGLDDDLDDDDLIDVLPPMGAVQAGLYRHLPWVVLVVVLGLIFVATAYAGRPDPAPDAPRVLEAGDCVDVAPGPVATVVSCAGPHELRIVQRVADPDACPAGTERRRLDLDGLTDCVVAG